MSHEPKDMVLAALLSSRICHDLVSPVGAITNGVDLIRELGSGDLADEVGMIGQSATRASSLLEFYRVAFGAAEAGSSPIGRAQLEGLARRMFATARIALDWPDTAGPPLVRPEARLLAQILLCARAVMGMSGLIAVQLSQTASFPMQVSILGDGLARAADLLDALAGAPLPELSPRLVEFALVGAASRDLGIGIRVDREPGKAVITAERT